MKFEELSDRAKERVIYTYSEFLADMNDWWEPLEEDLQAELNEQYGLDDVKIEFQLAYVQSDTVLFHLKNESLSNDLLTAAGLDYAGVIAEQLAHKFGVLEKNIPELEDELLRNSSVYGDVGITNPSGVTVELDGLYDAIVEGTENGEGEVDGTEVQKEIDKIEAAVNDALYERARKFYDQLREEWEFQTSEEEVAEAAEANGWEYDEDGDIL